MKQDFIIIKKEICAKQNRKDLRIALVNTIILLTSMMVTMFLFVKIAFWIWRG